MITERDPAAVVIGGSMGALTALGRLLPCLPAEYTLPVFIVVHLGANAIGVAYCVFLSFVIAEVINYAARVWYYRRGV